MEKNFKELTESELCETNGGVLGAMTALTLGALGAGLIHMIKKECK